MAATRAEYYDFDGNLQWLQDERGFITYNQYDVATGGRSQTIRDVDGTQLALPAGWTTPPGGGLHLVTDYTVDDLGRTTEELGPVHDVDGSQVRTAQWTVYRDDLRQVWSARGWLDVASSLLEVVSPIGILQKDAAGRTLEQIQAVRAPTAGPFSAAEAFPQPAYCRWTVNNYGGNLLNWTRVYHAIPAEGPGDEGTNYAQTDYDYDGLGRQNMVRAPGGTITRTVLDPRGNPLAIYVGTWDVGATDADPTGGGTPGNNMVLVTQYEYDGGQSGGNGNLTQLTRCVDATTARTTSYGYDWRDRRITTDGEEDFFQALTYGEKKGGEKGVREEWHCSLPALYLRSEAMARTSSGGASSGNVMPCTWLHEEHPGGAQGVSASLGTHVPASQQMSADGIGGADLLSSCCAVPRRQPWRPANSSARA